MTLIEVMVVVVLVALAGTGVRFAFGAITKSSLRSGCMKVMAASRFGYSRAITQGKTVRLVFDLDNNTMALQEASGRITLARADTGILGEDSAAEAIDPWQAAQARLEETFEPALDSSPFGPILGRDDVPMKKYGAQPVADGVKIERVYVAHMKEPVDSGTVAIHFFPGGLGEKAVVQLSGGGDTIYSVSLQPLTGRGEVHNFAYEPEDVLLGDDKGSVEDPG